MAIGLAACMTTAEPLWSTNWTSDGVYEGPPLSTGAPSSQLMRVAQLPDHDRPPDGYIMVVLQNRAGKEIERWGGPIDLRVDKPTRYRACRSGKRWLWREIPSQHLRVKAPTRTSGKAGQEVTEWATSRSAAKLVVVVVPYPGEAEQGASRTGMGTRGQGKGWDVMRTVQPPVHDPTAPVSDKASTGLGEVGNGPGRGQGQGEHDGTGTSTKGTRRGVSIGSEDPSWVDNPRAELAKRGGRTPADGGKANGSSGGKTGGQGNVSGAGWFNLLDVPESVAPAVAATVILLEADVLGFAQKLLNRVLRRLVGNALEEAIEKQAKAAVRRHKEVARARMASVKNPPSTAHLDEVMEYMPDEMLLAYYRQLARVASERKAIHRATVARTDGLTDEVSEYTHEMAKQNANAWGTIEHAAQRRLAAEEAEAAQRAAQLRAASSPSSTTATGTTMAPKSATGTPGTSVRTGTAVSTPGHTIVRKGGKDPCSLAARANKLCARSWTSANRRRSVLYWFSVNTTPQSATRAHCL